MIHDIKVNETDIFRGTYHGLIGLESRYYILDDRVFYEVGEEYRLRTITAQVLEDTLQTLSGEGVFGVSGHRKPVRVTSHRLTVVQDLK